VSDTNSDNSSDDDLIEHIDERWLVSYADMMTLLFGLFVLLFSIASEKQGKGFDQQLKEISESSFANKPNSTPAPINKPDDQSVDQLVAPLETPPDSNLLKNEIETLKAQTLDFKKQLDDKKKLEEDFAKDNELFYIERQKLENQLKAIQNNETDLRKEIDQLRKTVASQKLPVISKTVPKFDPQIEEKLNEQIKNLKEQVLKEKAQRDESQRKIASLEKNNSKTNNAEKNNENLLAAIEKLEDKTKAIELKNQELEEQKNHVELKKQELATRAEMLQLQNNELAKKMSAMEKEALSISDSIIVILKWSTDKHDLDLTVTDPKGKKFQFKNRKFPSHPGELTLDSRSGPGAEIWQTDKIIPGIYTVNWTLYNAYNNQNDVVYSGSISSSRSRLNIPEGKFPAKHGANKTIRFKTNERGVIQLLP
jgi:myosin heavy subunit